MTFGGAPLIVNHAAKIVLKKLLGVVFIVLGLAALLTPLTPGSWLALIGLELLGIRLLLQRTFLSLLPGRYRQKAERLIERMKNKIPHSRR